MRIAVMGTGGLGSYIGARLAEGGENVVFIARGGHLAAMQRDGLRVESPVGNIRLHRVAATDDPAAIGPVDLILFTVKLWDTETAASGIIPMIGEATRVVTLQNGIDSVEMIARSVLRRHVIGGVVYISAKLAEPGLIINPGGQQRLIVDRANGDATIAAFAGAATRCRGIKLELTDALDTAIWEKFAVNACFSASTSLTRAGMGAIMANPESRAFVRQLLDEALAVGEAAGAGINPSLPDLAMADFAALPPGIRSSMAEDLLRGRKLEISWMSGRIHGLGQKLGVPTPAHTVAYRSLLLHANGAADSQDQTR